MTPAIQELCRGLWVARDAARTPDAMRIYRSLAQALAEDVAAHAHYDPSEDRRVEWVLGIIRRRQRGDRSMQVGAALEFIIGEQLAGRPLIPLTGKEYAAGEVCEA